MADLTSPYRRSFVNNLNQFANVPLVGITTLAEASHQVWKGDLLYTVTALDGYFKAFKTGDTATGAAFGGVAEENQFVDVVTDGAVKCRALQSGWVSFPVGTLTQANIGAEVSATDAVTLTLTPGFVVGVLKEIEGDKAFVDITGYTKAL